MPALLSTLGVFAMILVLARFRLPLGLAILLGAVAIGALFGMGPGRIADCALIGVSNPGTIGLVMITVAILTLSAIMEATGRMTEIVVRARAVFRRPAVTMAALPAMIGLLPMPGGALFSAPMVASAAGDETIRGDLLSATNYWFRHIWEYWWPVYPGVLLASRLTDAGPAQFAALQMPLGILMASAGLLILRRMHPNLHTQADKPPPGAKRRLLLAIAPVWIIMLVWLPAAAVLRWTSPSFLRTDLGRTAGQLAPILSGILVSIVWTALTGRLGRKAVRGIFAHRRIYTLSALVIAVMIFQHTLKSVGVAENIGAELTAAHVPLVAVVAVLPFIAGMVTGLAIGFVGTSFPIVLGLVAHSPSAGSIWPYVTLAYAFGHMGQMLSPIHACHVVSNRYFRTTFGPVYRQIIPSAVVTMALSVGYFLLLRAILN